MDMKRILQALDGATTKPVEGANDMSKFLRIISEGATPIPAMPDIAGLQPGQPKDLGQGTSVVVNKDGTVSYSGGWGVYIYNAQGQHIKTQSPSFAGYSQEKDATGNVTQQNYQQGPMNIQQGPQGTTANYNIAGQDLTTQINEGANPHKVSLPVQMAMQHYQKPQTAKKSRPALIDKYFSQVENEQLAEKQERRQLINQYASVIAERIRLKEGKTHISPSGVKTNMSPTDDDYAINYGKNGLVAKFRKDQGMDVKTGSKKVENFNPNVSPNPGFKPGAGPGIQSAVAEDENQPDVVSLDIPLLIRLLEYAREDAQTDMDLHNVAERLIALSAEGATLSMGDYESIVSPGDMSEGKKIKAKKKSDPCWSSYQQIGVKRKDGETVPNCVPRARKSVNELSSETLGKYKKAASAAASAADKASDYKTGDKRFSGIVKATKKQFDNDLKKHSGNKDK